MYEYNYSKNIKLNNGLREFITDFEGDYCVTAVFNRDVGLAGAKASIKDWYVRVSKKLYGKKWHKKNAGQRLQYIAVVEHRESNLHWHLVVKLVDTGLATRFEAVAADCWTKYNTSGSMMIDKIATAGQNEKIGSYFTKETWKVENYNNFIISDGF